MVTVSIPNQKSDSVTILDMGIKAKSAVIRGLHIFASGFGPREIHQQRVPIPWDHTGTLPMVIFDYGINMHRKTPIIMNWLKVYELKRMQIRNQFSRFTENSALW